MHAAMHHLRSIHCCQQEETDKSHSSLGIIAEPGIGSPAITMPQPLPDVHIEQSSAVPGASLPLPGEIRAMRLSLLHAARTAGMREVTSVRISNCMNSFFEENA